MAIGNKEERIVFRFKVVLAGVFCMAMVAGFYVSPAGAREACQPGSGGGGKTWVVRASEISCDSQEWADGFNSAMTEATSRCESYAEPICSFFGKGVAAWSTSAGEPQPVDSDGCQQTIVCKVQCCE